MSDIHKAVTAWENFYLCFSFCVRTQKVLQMHDNIKYHLENCECAADRAVDSCQANDLDIY